MEAVRTILSITDLSVTYKDLKALDAVNLELKEGEVCCVIGEEGAGKSTLLKAITRQTDTKGGLYFGGRDLYQLSADDLFKAGIDYILQGGNILNGLTVEEHLCLALSEKKEQSMCNVWKELDMIFPRLSNMRKRPAAQLSGGERMQLSFACLWIRDAQMWVLDEPTAGLSPEMCQIFEDLILRVKKSGTKTILLLEHNYDFAFSVSDAVVVLKHAKLGPKYTQEIFRDETFVEAYLYHN